MQFAQLTLILTVNIAELLLQHYTFQNVSAVRTSNAPLSQLYNEAILYS